MSGSLNAVLFDVDDALYATYWSRQRPFRGAAELLRACKKRGLRVVLASSADQQEFAALRAALHADDAIDASTSSGAGAAEIYDGPAGLLAALPDSLLGRRR